jgi:hypothetical protein
MNRLLLSSLLALALAACAAHGPVVDRGDKPPSMSGTISGFVRMAGSNTPLATRKVTATETSSGSTYSASTAANGGYTMKVPMGKYRLHVELQSGEAVVEAPGELQINRSDLDAGRNFTIAVKR